MIAAVGDVSRASRRPARKARIVDVASGEYYGAGYQDILTRVPSIRRARKILGWEPKVSLEEGIRRTLDFYLKRRRRRPMIPRRVALKVDCDTAEGTRDGVPRLLEIFAARGDPRDVLLHARAGPLGSSPCGAIFTRKGFLRKMLRSRAPSLYGWRTMLSGTLLPAPMIGERCADAMRAGGPRGPRHGRPRVGPRPLARSARRDDAPRRSGRDYGRAHAEYLRIFGVPARTSAAPGWTANARSLEAQEERSLLFASDTRGGSYFFPRAGGRVFRTLEIPTTLPTLDETLGWEELSGDEDQRAFFRKAARGTEVHTIHAEVEGRSKAALFEQILDDWLADGVAFPQPLGAGAGSPRASRGDPGRGRSRARRLPGRAGFVTTGWPETPAHA